MIMNSKRDVLNVSMAGKIVNFDQDLSKHFQLPTETVVQRCSVKNVFLKNSQNSQENTCARVSFLIKEGLQL